MHDLQYLRWKVNFQRKQIDAPADTAHSGGGAVTGAAFIWISAVDCGVNWHTIRGKIFTIGNGSEMGGGGNTKACL